MRTLYLLYATYSSGFNIVFKILPAFLIAFFGAFEIALIYTAYFAARVLIVPAGLTSDRLGAVTTIRLSFSLMALMIVGFLVAFGVTSLSGWIIFALITGLVVNLIEIASAAIAAATRTRIANLFVLESMYQVGVVLGPVIGGLLTLYWGMEAALVTWAVLNIAGILATGKVESPIKRGRKFSRVFLSTIRKRLWAFLLMMAIGSFMTGFIQAIQELAFPLYIGNIGFNIAWVGLIIGGASVITILAMMRLGKAFEHRSPFASLFILFALMLVFPIITPFAGDALSLTILGGIFLVGRASSLNITRGFFSGFSDTQKATLIGIGDTVYYLSRSAGSAATGAMIESWGYGAMFMSMGILTLFPMAVLAAVCLNQRR